MFSRFTALSWLDENLKVVGSDFLFCNEGTSFSPMERIREDKKKPGTARALHIRSIRGEIDFPSP